MFQVSFVPKDGGHRSCKSRRQTILQRCPDKVFRSQAGEDLREKILVGEVSETGIPETSSHPRQHTILKSETCLNAKSRILVLSWLPVAGFDETLEVRKLVSVSSLSWTGRSMVISDWITPNWRLKPSLEYECSWKKKYFFFFVMLAVRWNNVIIFYFVVNSCSLFLFNCFGVSKTKIL